MKIQFDYRFDTNGFFTEERKAALNKAGEIWSDLLQDDFAEIPANTEFTVQNPQTGVAKTVVSRKTSADLTIFVGAAPQPFNGVIRESTAAEDLGSLAQAQYEGIDIQGDIFQRRISGNFRGQGAVTDFEPWVGTISVTTNPPQEWDFSLNNPDPNKIDFISVVLHEIGHILGLGTAPIFDVLGAEGEFKGVNAKEINNGNPIPLESDLGHIKEGFAGDKVLLDAVLGTGRRSPNEIDLAILADIGYEIIGFTKQGSLPEIATAEGESILGTIIHDRLDGLGGDDEIQGNFGNDTLLGESGNDSLFGETGFDELFGGVGNDLLSGDEQADTLDGGSGNDSLFGGSEDDLLFGDRGEDRVQGDSGDDTLRGNDGNDSLLGGAGDDVIFGNSGTDRLQGDIGNDILRGGSAADTLFGEAGDDTIEGGTGNDSLVGNGGADRFEFGLAFGNDRINDFTTREDKIAISGEYDFATDTYDLNRPSEIVSAITRTGEVAGSTDRFTDITLRNNQIVTIIHDEPLTTANIEIYFPFQSRVIPNPSGFKIELNQAINLDRLNLYQGLKNNINAFVPDLRLTSKTTGETILGSLVLTEGDRSLTFIKSDGILPPDDYAVALFSRNDGFISQTGELLDGDLDGIAGENLIAEFTVEEEQQRVLSIGDFSRGRGQTINNPLTDRGMPITLNDGTDVTAVEFTVTYDETILSLTDIAIATDLGDDWTLTAKDLSNPGTAMIALSGTTALNSGEVDLVRLQAIVPETATNGKSGILNLETANLNNGEINAIGDSAFQQVNYLGDTDGDRAYSNLDAYNVSLFATGISDGFSDLSLTNPHIIGDINGDGVISAFDSYLIAKKAGGKNINLIPDLLTD